MLKTTALAILLVSPVAWAQPSALRLVEAARTQIGVTVLYDPGYVKLAYPGGDVPQDRGVCTDVVVRAYRKVGADLQVLVHQDMKRAWSTYPNTWRMKGTDRNIDHRRVPNLATFFTRHGQVVRDLKTPSAFLPGDVVTWRLASGVPHIGLVSDRKGDSGAPLVIHNIGSGAQEEDVLFSYTVTGHYRYAPQ